MLSGGTEKLALSTSKYFKTMCAEEDDIVLKGENILKYTNGTYLVAPYNCVITEKSLPNPSEVCTNKHYIIIQSTDTLEISMQVEESEINTVYVGQEAKIEIEALDNKSITGYITNIDNTATYSSSGSKFKITVGFENDGEILLGMSAKCSIILEKAENVIAVTKEAVKEEKNKKHVIVKTQNGQTQNIEIETGIENDAYAEVKSGLIEGDIVLIEETAEEETKNVMQKQMQKQFNGETSSQRPEKPMTQ